MLTKADLKEIRKIVREEVEAESQNVKDELQADIKMSQIRVIGEINSVKDRLKNLEIKIIKIQKDIKTIVNFFDKEYIGIRKRVEKIEKHLHIEPASP